MRKNLIIDTDAYKMTHWLGYPENLNKLYSYAESRIGSKYPRVLFFGLSMIIQDHLLQPVTDQMIEEARLDCLNTFGTDKYFNIEVWRKVKKLGYLPIKIKAAPEGTIVDVDNVLFTIESTEDWFAKTANSIEGTLMHTWYPTTVATRAMGILENIKPAFEKSSMIGDIILPVAVNDFGYRGATCHEAAARGGAGFLLSFIGSDNMAASRALKDYYRYSGRGKSVWATEHSVATSFGLKFEDEIDYLYHQLTKSDPSQIISIVIDSNDADNFISAVACSPDIMKLIKERTGRVVFRPDRGVPLRNMVIYSDMLSAKFGFDMNEKGYKIIKDNVGLLQGDGMDEISIPQLYNEYIKTGYAADNFITGSGGGLLQIDINRDTQRFAIKASYGEREGKPIDICKSGTGDITKASKSGKLKLHRPNSTYTSKDPQFEGYTDLLETVYKNGQFKKVDFEDILSNMKRKY